MSIISKCPKCQRAITVPDGIVPDASVRCPICEEEYPLSEALAEAPPALIPVGGSGDSDVLGAEMPGTAAAKVGAGDAADGEAAADQQSPDLGYALKRSAEGVTEEPIDFDLDGEETAEGQGPGMGIATTVARPAKKKKKKSKGVVRIMAEVIIGGFGGVFLMYYGLNFFTGNKDHDFLNIYLPGVPHTYDHWPGSGIPTEDESQAPEESPAPAPTKVAVNTGVSEPTPPSATPRTTPPAKRKPKGGRLRDGGHPLNRIDASHRTMASLLEEPDDLPPPMEVPKGLKLADRGPPPLAEDYLGPADPLPVTSKELGDALKKANEWVIAEDTGLMDNDAYEKFRQLGELVTFVRGWPDDTSVESRKHAVEKVLEKLGTTADQPEKIGELADAFLKGGPGNQDGILLSGKVGPVGEKSGVCAAMVYITGQESKIFVMSHEKLPFDKGNNVVVLGTIVMDPAIDITGLSEPLEWDKGMVVWLGSAAKLD